VTDFSVLETQLASAVEKARVDPTDENMAVWVNAACQVEIWNMLNEGNCRDFGGLLNGG
jgi:hypothetical protein